MRYEPMKYADGGMSKVDRLAANPDWVFEQKMDGTRGMAVITHDRPVWWPGRGGRGALAHTAATQHLPAINAAIQKIVGGTPALMVLDGEIMTGTGEYHVWDIPYLRINTVEVIRNEDTWAARHAALEELDKQGVLADSPVKIVRVARTAEEKAALLDAVAREGGEGLVAKHVKSVYKPGERTEAAVKIKFVKTADVIVLRQTRQPTNSIEFGVMGPDGTSIVKVGACSGIGRPTLEPGQVIEIEYLYFTDGKVVYQPRMKQIRTDKEAIDCDLRQFRSYSRRAV